MLSASTRQLCFVSIVSVHVFSPSLDHCGHTGGKQHVCRYACMHVCCSLWMLSYAFTHSTAGDNAQRTTITHTDLQTHTPLTRLEPRRQNIACSNFDSSSSSLNLSAQFDHGALLPLFAGIPKSNGCRSFERELCDSCRVHVIAAKPTCTAVRRFLIPSSSSMNEDFTLR